MGNEDRTDPGSADKRRMKTMREILLADLTAEELDLDAKAFVCQRYSTAEAVGISSSVDDAFFGVRIHGQIKFGVRIHGQIKFVGVGITESDAWKNAARRIVAAH